MSIQTKTAPRRRKHSNASFLLGALVARWFLAVPAVAQPPVAAVPETQVFKNVNVVSMNPEDRLKVRRRQTVVIENGEIVTIGKARKVKVPAGAEVINGRRKYLLPGLYDMHAHGEDVRRVPEGMTEEELYSFYLANGITGVYDPWGFKEIFKWQRDIERGKTVGPRLHFSSPGANDENHVSADAVEESVRQWARQGYKAIKVHSPITREKFERLHAVARELGIPVVGHALRPRGFPIQATLDQGQSMIAHIEEILTVSVPFRNPENFRDDLTTPLADVAASRVWVTTTVGTYDIIVKTVGEATFDQLFARPEMRYLPPSVHDFWRNENLYLRDDFLQDPEFWARLLDVKLYIANEMKNLGALDRLLFGTDSGIPLLIPGFGIHDELRLLVKGGLTPWEVLQTATYNPAVFLETIEERGTVEVGKRADLLLVNKNPLRNVANLKKLTGVMVDGTWLAKADLDARLEALAKRWE